MNQSNRLVTFACLAGILIAACNQAAANPDASPEPTAGQPTPRPTRTSLVVTAPRSRIETTGQMVPARSVDLIFNQTGQVVEILDEPGSAVKAGSMIARLSGEREKAVVAQAEARLASAQAQLALLPQSILEAEADWSNANAKWAAAVARQDNAAALLAVQAQLIDARGRVRNAQARLDRALAGAEQAAIDEARRNLAEATSRLQAAQARFADLQPGSPNSQADSADVAAAFAEVQAAEARLERLRAEVAGEIEGTAAANVREAEGVLMSARAALSDTIVYAPFDGTLAQIDVIAGQQVREGQRAGIFADLSSWRIVTNSLLETEVANISIGQSVTVVLDAFPDLQLKGEVETIGLVSRNDSSRVTYPVTIKLLDDDPRIRWGMTAMVSFEQ